MPVELATQTALRDGQPLAALQRQYALKVATHPAFPLVILNYDQCESRPKSHPIVRECRALVLEAGTWNVAARAFPRFFAWGETPDCDKQFDWTGAHVQEKHDGSLVLVYWYGGRLFVNTRGSFGIGPVQRGLPLSWEEVFFSALAPAPLRTGRNRMEDHLPEGFTAVFELCSPYNRIVRKYAAPAAYLLTVFDTQTGNELAPDLCDEWADEFGAKRPAQYVASSLADLHRHLAYHPDPTFEGFVATDKSLRRKKVKSGRYEALHRVKCGVEPALSPKTFAPFVAHGGDATELIELLGADEPHLHAARERAQGLLAEIGRLWTDHQSEPDQKAFAMAVAPCEGRSFLFEARKRGCSPVALWTERAEGFLATWLEKTVPRGAPAPTDDSVAEAIA